MLVFSRGLCPPASSVLQGLNDAFRSQLKKMSPASWGRQICGNIALLQHGHMHGCGFGLQDRELT